MRLDVQGIGKDKVYTDERAVIKLTLGWELVYEFEVWIMPHFAGVDVILGTDFMIPAGVRLDLFKSTMQNPDEVYVEDPLQQDWTRSPRKWCMQLTTRWIQQGKRHHSTSSMDGMPNRP
ncbi:unnamed protein product [Phytophthora lilii]|uniref:Unnamed protein product n=1 Tax=Phytophthora lilii TaxID=2077276 RepID=A0A9W6UFG4_9STRA|nr:unnamed protein product [Phytophthora lilii]